MIIVHTHRAESIVDKRLKLLFKWGLASVFQRLALHFKSDSAFVSQRVKRVLKDQDALGWERTDKLVEVRETEIKPKQNKKKTDRTRERWRCETDNLGGKRKGR